MTLKSHVVTTEQAATILGRSCSTVRRYVHRHTLDHVYGGTPLQNITDTQWLAEHAFPLRSDGAIDERYTHCGPAFLAEGEATDG